MIATQMKAGIKSIMSKIYTTRIGYKRMHIRSRMVIKREREGGGGIYIYRERGGESEREREREKTK